MFQVLLVTHFCTCEIGCVGVDYLEWDFSEQSSRHCPGACPTHACLMAVICEWDRTRSAHCASLMKTGRFSSDQAWNSQVVCPWHFSSVQIGMCGVMCMRERRTESQRASEREKERIMLFLFQRPCCPKLAKVYGNQTGRGQMEVVWNSRPAANVRLLFFHLTQYSSMSARCLGEKRHCA